MDKTPGQGFYRSCSGRGSVEARESQSRARGHTTKIILWGSRSSIVISRRHKGEVTTSTTSSTSTLVGAHPCLLIPKAQITSNHYFAQDLSQDPPGNDDLLVAQPHDGRARFDAGGHRREHRAATATASHGAALAGVRRRGTLLRQHGHQPGQHRHALPSEQHGAYSTSVCSGSCYGCDAYAYAPPSGGRCRPCPGPPR